MKTYSNMPRLGGIARSSGLETCSVCRQNMFKTYEVTQWATSLRSIGAYIFRVALAVFSLYEYITCRCNPFHLPVML